MEGHRVLEQESIATGVEAERNYVGVYGAI